MEDACIVTTLAVETVSLSVGFYQPQFQGRNPKMSLTQSIPGGVCHHNFRSRPKDEVNNDGVAGKYKIVHSPSLSSNQVQTICHMPVQAEFPSTIPREVEPGMHVLHSEFSPKFSPDGLQLDGRAEISHSDSGWYLNHSSKSQSAYVGARSEIVTFILEDERLGSLLSEAYKRMDEVAFLWGLTEDLTIYAKDLSLEGLNERKGQADISIGSKSNPIARET
jgi:hypothetical protein